MKSVAINSSGGGSDIGATGNGIVEKDLTLKISNRIKEVLESNGIEVLMLRNGDETISYDDRIKKLKATYPVPNDVVLLSNTLNSGGTGGIEIIYPLSNNNILPSSIGENLEYFNTTKYYQYRWPTDTTKDYYYITRNTPDYETIIVRYGYVDNKNDAELLKNDYLKMADAVADAILNYIGVITEDVYIVKSGDTLYGIANKFNTTVNDIKQLNNLTTNNLSIGQSLKIPEIEAPSSTENNINYYKVKSGDTLYSIAKKFNINVNKLKDINNLNSNLISIGQNLKVNDYGTYVVKKGDTLYNIAKNNNTTVQKLKDINNLKSDNLSIGMVLYMP